MNREPRTKPDPDRMLVARTFARYRKEITELRAERDRWREACGRTAREVDEGDARADRLEAERDKLREALAAYRSAMRSGEPESERMRQQADAALAHREADRPEEDR